MPRYDYRQDMPTRVEMESLWPNAIPMPKDGDPRPPCAYCVMGAILTELTGEQFEFPGMDEAIAILSDALNIDVQLEEDREDGLATIIRRIQRLNDAGHIGVAWRAADDLYEFAEWFNGTDD